MIELLLLAYPVVSTIGDMWMAETLLRVELVCKDLYLNN